MTGSTPVPLVASFTALRFTDADHLGAFIAPPYDVISPEARARLAERSARNIVHVILPEDPVDRYDRACRTLAQWRWNGTVGADEGPTLTVMRQEFTTADGRSHRRTGLFATVAAEPYEAGRVRPHERTHAGPKEDRLNLLRATRTAADAIFLLSRDRDGVLLRFLEDTVASEPAATAELEGVKIELWIVPGEEGREMLAIAGEEPLYIADGHHRYETAVAYSAERGIEGRIIGFIVPVDDPGLVVLPTHRVIRGNRVAKDEFLRGVAPHVQLTDREEAECTIVWPDGSRTGIGSLEETGGGSGRSGSADPSGDLLIARVERALIGPMVVAAGAGAEVAYTADAAEAVAQVTSGDAAAAVLVAPTAVGDVLAVADAGGVMPPKSTYFYPKVPSGIVLWPMA